MAEPGPVLLLCFGQANTTGVVNSVKRLLSFLVLLKQCFHVNLLWERFQNWLWNVLCVACSMGRSLQGDFPFPFIAGRCSGLRDEEFRAV